MRNERKYRGAAVLGAAALAVGLLASAAPASPALASTALASTALTSTVLASSGAASPTARSTATYDLTVVAGDIKALGSKWNLEVQASKSFMEVEFYKTNKGVSENHLWSSSPSFAPTAAKELTVSSTEHAALKTGTALSPVLAVSLAFTPSKASKQSCRKGSSTTYRGHVTGSVKLVTGLRGVKLKLKLGKKLADAFLFVDRSCVQAPPKALCPGAAWTVSSASGSVFAGAGETPGDKPPWDEMFSEVQPKTASKWLSREDGLDVAGGSAPKLNTTAHTVAVAMKAASAISGSAVISYTHATVVPPTTCYVGKKRYSETTTDYEGDVTVTKPFKAHTVLTGVITLTPGAIAGYTGISLKAK